MSARLVRASLALLASIGLFISALDAIAGEAVPRLDVSIAGVVFQDPASSAPFLKELAASEVSGLLEYQFSNAGRTETLTLVQHPGGARFDIEEARVASSVSEPAPVLLGAPAQFVSGLGVKLGMSRVEVVRALGSPDRESEGELEYRYTLEKNRETLQPFNMPEYRGLYRFEAGRLVGFEFGFPYP